MISGTQPFEWAKKALEVNKKLAYHSRATIVKVQMIDY
jgi:hypothetical protein